MPNTYATWNPADKHADITLSEGNLKATNSGSWRSVRATIGKGSGKHYFEVTLTDVTYLSIGLATAAAALTSYPGASDYGCSYDRGVIYRTPTGIFATNGKSGPDPAAGAILCIAFDCDAGKMWFGVNGTWIGSGNPAAGTDWSLSFPAGTTLFPAAGVQTANCTANFGASAFTYTVPSGFNSGIYTGPVIVEIPAASLSLAAHNPSILPIFMEAAGLTLTVPAPSYVAGIGVPAAGLALSAHAPTILLSRTIAVPVGALILTPRNPSYTWELPASSRPAVQAIYKCYLTGDGETPPLADLEIPISSFQSTLRDGDPSYVSVVVPNSIAYSSAISARANGDIVVKKGYRMQDGAEVLEEIARVDYESLRIDRGGRSDSATISGHKTISSSAAKSCPISGLSYYSLQADGKRRLRGEVDLFLRCGDTVEFVLAGQDDSFIVGSISYTVGPNQATMEVAEA